jgi:hypothetical protein
LHGSGPLYDLIIASSSYYLIGKEAHPEHADGKTTYKGKKANGAAGLIGWILEWIEDN